MRRAAKQLAERGLVYFVAPARRRLLRNRAVVLAYHNVVPDDWEEGGDRSLHLARRDLVEQLDALQATHDVVPLAALLDRRSPALRRPRAAITFDDAYEGAVRIALPELARRGLPCTVFTTPGALGGSAFWWDELAQPRLGLDPDVRAIALDSFAGDGAAVRQWARTSGLPPHAAPEFARTATLEELQLAVRTGPVKIAAHTWTHPNLTRVGDDRLAVELRRPLAWLDEHVGAAAAPYVSFPYGLFDDRVVRAAFDAGYVAAFGVDGGWLPRRTDPGLVLPRVNVPAGMSGHGFRLRASGLLA